MGNTIEEYLESETKFYSESGRPTGNRFMLKRKSESTVRFIVDFATAYHFSNDRRVFRKMEKVAAPAKVLCAKKGTNTE